MCQDVLKVEVQNQEIELTFRAIVPMLKIELIRELLPIRC